MMNTPKIKLFAISLNINLPLDFKDYIEKLQDELITKYNDTRDYVNAPHLNVITKFIMKEDIDNYIQILSEICKVHYQFTIKTDMVSISDNHKYLSLNFDTETLNYIYNLRNIILEETKDIGHLTSVPTKNVRIYTPHISILKNNPEIIDIAYNETKDQMLVYSEIINNLEIVQESDKYSDQHFQVVKNIELQKKLFNFYN